MWMPFTYNALGSTPSQKDDKQLGTCTMKAKHARPQPNRLTCRAQRKKHKAGRRANIKKHTKLTLVPQVHDKSRLQQGAALSTVPKTAVSGGQLGGQPVSNHLDLTSFPDCAKHFGGVYSSSQMPTCIASSGWCMALCCMAISTGLCYTASWCQSWSICRPFLQTLQVHHTQGQRTL